MNIVDEILDFCKIDSDQVDDETKGALGSILADNTIKELEAIQEKMVEALKINPREIQVQPNLNKVWARTKWSGIIQFRIDELKTQYGL